MCVSGTEPVWPSGKALGWYEAEGPRFESASALLSQSKLVVCGHCLVILSLTDNYETFKMALIAAHRLNAAGSHSGGDSLAICI